MLINQNHVPVKACGRRNAPQDTKLSRVIVADRVKSHHVIWDGPSVHRLRLEPACFPTAQNKEFMFWRNNRAEMLDLQSRRWSPMTNQVSELQLGAPSYRWSNRILVLALAGILFLTLYPFRFSFHANLPGNRSPFFLVSGMKSSGLFAAFLNVLLFVPFGVGLSLKLPERGNSGVKVLLLLVAAGALLSYCIVFLHIFIPTRDSGWEGVFTKRSSNC